MLNQDTQYLKRVLELARKGIGLVSPNPMVGAVLVKDNKIIGEGFHQYQWRDHAEIVALKSTGQTAANAAGATLYVNLEPCCITGRTGPCTEALVRAKISRVVAPMADPNPAVAGRGFAQLRAAGVAVETGACEAEAKRLNEAFACWIKYRRPLVTLKSAMTLNGQLAHNRSHRSANGERAWITSEESRAEVHRMRHASDALLTGIGTVLADDPLLTDRSGLLRRRKLLRVILDSRLRIPLKCKVIKTADDDLLVVTTQPVTGSRARALQKAGVEVINVRTRGGRPDFKRVLDELGRRDILSVLLEAGSELNGAALSAGLVDRMLLFYAPQLAGNAQAPFARFSRRKPVTLPTLQNLTVQRFGPDVAVGGTLRDVYGNH
ncbi:MAG TPA: bifunctional diaminohydroxyphosphoribosylaminopyrimidine deaminase/5-amino-6-(5-phosphoribosylamino)uracil reductase RibD [Candidatus Dormibacteraeota bacterium]|nr:bifunctional diaminohydroxyphosphoribosylaminopyrimidine deaminase/5-amino-6-(5-phosphoribosylamino)uracil reductase RibD [Candidatus Dormibacteraeota bacterium]